MKSKLVALALLASLMAAPAVAQSVPLDDAPALAARGAYSVGVMRLDVTHPGQPDLSTGAKPVPRADRVLPLTIWYPAAGKGRPARYLENTPGPVAKGGRESAALVDAAPVTGKAVPLVVLSHGYFNWATAFSDLAENLASKGYVVAAIDHRDGDRPKANQNSFAMVLYSRSADQRFVIDELTRRATSGPLAGTYDPANVAVVGYSMGGFGAVVTAGAGFDPTSPAVQMAPENLLSTFAEGAAAEAPPPGLKAIVTLAPWGGAAPLRMWRESGVANIKVPALVIVGDHDDVSGFEGVRWIYDHMGGDRRLLVYQNARHNIAGDGVGMFDKRDFALVERAEEPVWRRDRILAINRHFVTAFLDATLKGDAGKAAFLDVPTEKADAGVWPLAPGQSSGAATADKTTAKGYWPGFQRRWALGLELHHAAPTRP